MFETDFYLECYLSRFQFQFICVWIIIIMPVVFFDMTFVGVAGIVRTVTSDYFIDTQAIPSLDE